MTMTDFREEEHPRDEKGKFTDSIDSEPIMVRGDELGTYGNIRELRLKAEEYYRDKLQGSYVNNKDIGDVRFSKKGRREFFYYSGEEDKIKLVPYLKNIIINGKLKYFRKLEHIRIDGIIGFYYLETNIIQNNKLRNIETIIGKDKTGNLFYDLFVDNPKEKRTRKAVSENLNPDISATGDIPTIIQNSLNVNRNLELNLNITNERPLLRDERIKIGNREFKNK
jgi:hypothetical protein